MKGNKIDDLFREKLSHQKLTPPPAAWAAVEAGLPGKKKKGVYFWFSVAAGILLICTLGWVVLQDNNATNITSPKLIADASPKQNTPKQPIESQLEASTKTDASTKSIEETTSASLKTTIEEPGTEKLVASVKSSSQKVAETNDIVSKKNIAQENTAMITDLPIAQGQNMAVVSIDPSQHLSISRMAQDFDYSTVMPLVLTDYFSPYSEDIKLTSKKKRFRVLNGIISIAKEVNSSKLSFSELRNAKNSFVNEDLKYGTKSEEEKAASSEDENTEDEPNKD